MNKEKLFSLGLSVSEVYEFVRKNGTLISQEGGEPNFEEEEARLIKALGREKYNEQRLWNSIHNGYFPASRSNSQKWLLNEGDIIIFTGTQRFHQDIYGQFSKKGEGCRFTPDSAK